MSETYPNGKVTFTSLAAPTEADLAAWHALSEEGQETIRQDRAQRAWDSGMSDASVQDIFERTRKKHFARISLQSQAS